MTILCSKPGTGTVDHSLGRSFLPTHVPLLLETIPRKAWRVCYSVQRTGIPCLWVGWGFFIPPEAFISSHCWWHLLLLALTGTSIY